MFPKEPVPQEQGMYPYCLTLVSCFYSQEPGDITLPHHRLKGQRVRDEQKHILQLSICPKFHFTLLTFINFSESRYFPFEQDTVVPRWSVICEALNREIKSVEDLEKAVLEYNSRYASRWKFRGLHILLEQVLYLQPLIQNQSPKL